MQWFSEGFRWFLLGWKNYANFRGRSRRKEYWYFILFQFIVVIFLIGLSLLYRPLSIVLIIFLIASIIPYFAVKVRRFQDTNHDWACLYVPFIFQLDILCADSDPKENRYGPDPKETEHQDFNEDSFQLSK